MPGFPDNERGSILLVEECFAAQDGRFIETLRRIDSPKWLAAFADRWKKDTRPWARAQIFAYLEQPLNCPGHQPVVKHLFKDAEERRDDELMGAFLVVFDTLVRRVRRTRYHWDRAARAAVEEEYLATPRDVIARNLTRRIINPRTGEEIALAPAGIPGGRLFTHRTRHYLRRRAWRYFRWLGYAQPSAFPAAVATALRRYRDEDLAKGENILDSWALLNLAFRGCDALEFRPTHLRLKEGRSLSELTAAPRFAAAWETPEALRILLDLVASAAAHLVRTWAMDLFRRNHAKVPLELSADELLALLDHDDEQVQQFGAELFHVQGGLEKLPLATWLRLLETRSVTALATVCDAFARHVSADRLSLAQCLELACVRPVPVARLGQKILTARTLATSDDAALAALADAQCPAVAGELATWALARLGMPGHYQLETVSRFFDSLTRETRDAAWRWLIADSAGYHDAALWSRLAETPFEDLRLRLVDHLALRARAPLTGPDALAPIWCSVLLGVHRGGRQKLKAVRQIADSIAREPARAPTLLPVLAVAIRSVRGPEARSGLAAVMTLLAARPELDAAVRQHLPELRFAATEVAA